MLKNSFCLQAFTRELKRVNGLSLMVCSHAIVYRWKAILTAKLWVDWIPSYLSSETKAALRAEMDKPPSTKDVPGYIYCYEIRDPKTPNQVHLKVGRAVKLVKRLDEWAKRCGSKEVVLRGWWPGAVIDDDGAGPSLLRGRIQAGEKGKYCHRLEREQSEPVLPSYFVIDRGAKPDYFALQA